MNKLSDLELITAIAKIEGVDILHPDDRCGRGSDQGLIQEIIETSETGVWTRTKDYNPLTDKAMLLDLAFKHEVNTCFAHKECFIINENAGEFDSGVISTKSFSDQQEYPRAVLECIVEANNG